MADVRTEARFWVAVAAAGIAAGITGIAVTGLLHLVQHLAYGYSGPTFLDDVRHADPVRRVVAMTVSGALAGTGWLLLRRRTGIADRGEDPDRPLPVAIATADGGLQIVVVAMGASLGREGAPRQIAAALAGRLTGLLGLDAGHRRLVVAAAAGAGLAAVYNVPLAGAVFAVEVVLGRLTARGLAAGLVASGLGTVVSWTVLPDRPTYQLSAVHGSWSLVVFAAVVSPLVAAPALLFRGAATRARRHRPVGRWLPVATTVTFAAVGGVAIAYPELLGNGRSSADLALTAQVTLGTAAVLLALKPLATIASLGSGASGGLIAPSVATGALAGAVAGAAWQRLWPGAGLAAMALVGGAAFLAVTQRAPVSAVLFVAEVTGALGTHPSVLPALVVAVAGARWGSGAAHRIAGRGRSLISSEFRRDSAPARRPEEARHEHGGVGTADAAVPRRAAPAPDRRGPDPAPHGAADGVAARLQPGDAAASRPGRPPAPVTTSR